MEADRTKTRNQAAIVKQLKKRAAVASQQAAEEKRHEEQPERLRDQVSAMPAMLEPDPGAMAALPDAAKKHILRFLPQSTPTPIELTHQHGHTSRLHDLAGLRSALDKPPKKSGALQESDTEKKGPGVTRVPVDEKHMTPASWYKVQGNDFVKRGDYESAIAQYSTAIELCGPNPNRAKLKAICFANRALARSKLVPPEYETALEDADVAITLDPSYAKAYFRRSSALHGLKRLAESRTALQLGKTVETAAKRGVDDKKAEEKQMHHCAICLRESNRTEPLPGCVLEPAHTFCEVCLHGMLHSKFGKTSECPLCGDALTGRNLSFQKVSLAYQVKKATGLEKKKLERENMALVELGIAANDDQSNAFRVPIEFWTEQGVGYDHGYGVPQDFNLAAKSFARAAAEGSTRAIVYIGHMHRDGRKRNFEGIGGTMPANRKIALAAYKDATKKGSAEGAYSLAQLVRDEDPHQAASYMQKAAKQGYADAQFILGNMYQEGDGVTKNTRLAMSWTKKAAEQGHVCAQETLGGMYGHQQRWTDAFDWWYKAAMQGNADAEYNVSTLFHGGKGTVQDSTKAAVFCRRAALAGGTSAQNNMAQFLWTGDGVEVNQTEAVVWWQKAAAQGHANAQRTLDQLDAQLKAMA
jgi:TPR repeat protein